MDAEKKLATSDVLAKHRQFHVLLQITRTTCVSVRPRCDARPTHGELPELRVGGFPYHALQETVLP